MKILRQSLFFTILQTTFLFCCTPDYYYKNLTFSWSKYEQKSIIDQLKKATDPFSISLLDNVQKLFELYPKEYIQILLAARIIELFETELFKNMQIIDKQYRTISEQTLSKKSWISSLFQREKTEDIVTKFYDIKNKQIAIATLLGVCYHIKHILNSLCNKEITIFTADEKLSSLYLKAFECDDHTQAFGFFYKQCSYHQLSINNDQIKQQRYQLKIAGAAACLLTIVALTTYHNKQSCIDYGTKLKNFTESIASTYLKEPLQEFKEVFWNQKKIQLSHIAITTEFPPIPNDILWGTLNPIVRYLNEYLKVFHTNRSELQASVNQILDDISLLFIKDMRLMISFSMIMPTLLIAYQGSKLFQRYPEKKCRHIIQKLALLLAENNQNDVSIAADGMIFYDIQTLIPLMSFLKKDCQALLYPACHQLLNPNLSYAQKNGVIQTMLSIVKN